MSTETNERPIHAWPIAEQWPASEPSGNSGQLAEPSEREAFEARFTRPPYEFDMSRWPENSTRTAWPGNYRSYDVECAWAGWQARAALSTPPAAAPAISWADAAYWLASRAGIIAALEQAGFRLMSNRDGFWLQATPAAADDWQARALAAEAKLAAQAAAVPAGFALVPLEITRPMWDAVNKLDDQCAAGNYDGKGCSIEQAWDCLVAAALQGEGNG